MSATTLVTFLVSVPGAHSVEVIGSWDNFSQPYPLQKDVQKGHGHWSGCHSFRNIVCDGDPAEPVEMRTGGLKLGGTYWYFYKVNGMMEYHDPAHPSTAYCPLLPGQTVNILHVPYFILPQASTDSLHELVKVNLTLNPEDRFASLRPRPTVKTATCEIERPLREVAVRKSMDKRYHSRLTTRPQSAGARFTSSLFFLNKNTSFKVNVKADQARPKSKRPRSVPQIPSDQSNRKQEFSSSLCFLNQTETNQSTSHTSWWRPSNHNRPRGFTNPFQKFLQETHVSRDNDHCISDFGSDEHCLPKRPYTSIQLQPMQCMHNVDRKSCQHKKCRRPFSAPSRLEVLPFSQQLPKQDIAIENTTSFWEIAETTRSRFHQSWRGLKCASSRETSSEVSSLASSFFGPSTEDTDAEFLTPIQSLSPNASSRTSLEDDHICNSTSHIPSRHRSLRSILGRSLPLSLTKSGTQATENDTFDNGRSLSTIKEPCHTSCKASSLNNSEDPGSFRLKETLVESLEFLSSSPELDLRFDSDGFSGRADLEPHKDPLFWNKLSSQETIKPAQPSSDHDSLPFREHSREDLTKVASINDRLLNFEPGRQWAELSGDIEDGTRGSLWQPERPIDSQEGQASVRGPAAAGGRDLVVELGYLGAMIA